MTINYNPISSVYSPSNALSSAKTSTASSTSELVTSFKEIFSAMMMSSSLSGTDQSTSMPGMTDLMAPLMLVLLEKLVEQQIEPASASPQLMPSGRPAGGVLTQDFHPGHNGLDFGIPVGTGIKSTMDGQVVYAGWNDQGYGNLVIIQNGDYKTYYAHLSSIPVSVGDSVTAGSVIGLSGNTGNSTGPHLHYEVRKNNVPIDPTEITLGITSTG